MTDRGFTWTEQHRHECEVRHVARLPTKGQRAAYFEGLEKWRGPDAVARLRADVAAAWYAAHPEKAAPPPPGGSPAPAASGPVHSAVNAACTKTVPGDGSFLGRGGAGSSDSTLR